MRIFLMACIGVIALSIAQILEIELEARLVERRDGAQSAILRAWIDNQILP